MIARKKNKNVATAINNWFAPAPSQFSVVVGWDDDAEYDNAPAPLLAAAVRVSLAVLTSSPMYHPTTIMRKGPG